MKLDLCGACWDNLNRIVSIKATGTKFGKPQMWIKLFKLCEMRWELNGEALGSVLLVISCQILDTWSRFNSSICRILCILTAFSLIEHSLLHPKEGGNYKGAAPASWKIIPAKFPAQIPERLKGMYSGTGRKVRGRMFLENLFLQQKRDWKSELSWYFNDYV